MGGKKATGRIARSTEIVRKMESLALVMLERAIPRNDAKIEIDVQLDVFDKVGRWVAIKNKLEDDSDTRIDEFKRRITGETDSERHYSPSRRPKGWTPPDTGGPRLAALKSRLPAGGAGGADGDRDAAERPAAPAVGRYGGIRDNLSGRAKPGNGEALGEPDL